MSYIDLCHLSNELDGVAFYTKMVSKPSADIKMKNGHDLGDWQSSLLSSTVVGNDSKSLIFEDFASEAKIECFPQLNPNSPKIKFFSIFNFLFLGELKHKKCKKWSY